MGKLTVKHSNPEGLFNKGLQPGCYSQR